MSNSQINYLPYVLKFDGKNDHIVLPEMNIDYSKGFTIEAWVYYNSFKPWSRIIDFCNIPPNKDKIVFANLESTNTLALDIKRGKADQRFIVQKALEIGQWIHLAATIDAAGNGKFYKNGQQIQAGKIHLPESINRTQNYIGKSHSPNDGFFDGRMSEVRLWNYARTAEELAKDLYRRFTGNEPGLVGYWSLNEGNGDIVYNKVNGSQGTIYQAIWEQQISLTNADLTEQLSDQTKKIAELENQNAEQTKKVTALEQQNADQTKKIAELENQNAEQTKKVTALEQQNADQTKKIAELEKKLSTLEQENTKLKQNYSEIEKRFAPVEEENTQLKQKVPGLELENTQLKQKNYELERKISEQLRVIDDRTHQITQLEKRLAELEDKQRFYQLGWQQVQKLQPADLKSESYFGEETALSGGWAIAGARKADSAEIQDAGIAYIFHLENNVWQQKQLLQPVDLRLGDQFGCAVALFGEWAIVGAGKVDGKSILDVGAAYVFRLENGVWREKQKLQPNDLNVNAYFGKGIVLTHEWAIIGAFHAKAGNIKDAGAAYIYRLENGIWQQRQKLQPSDLDLYQCFGNAIAISNEYAFIGGGDRFASAGIKRPGGAYIYRLENGVWKQHQKLLSPQLGTNDLFGYSVAVSGEYALVGAVNTTVSGVFGVGTVYVYKLEQGVWQFKQKLQPDRAKYCGFFGATVTINGEIAIIGSTRADSLNIKDSGEAYIYQLETGIWQCKRKLPANDLHYESYFGFSTAVDRQWIFASAAWANSSNSKRVGAIYIFESK